MRALRSPSDVAEASPDQLVRWAAQALLPGHPSPGGAAWEHGGAVGVRAPGLNRHERLVLSGPPEGVAAILREHAHDPALRPLVPADLVAPVRALEPDLVAWASFGWMERTGAVAAAPGVRWLLDDELGAAEALLRKVNSNPYVLPGDPVAARWAGVFVDGELAAVGADAWSAPDVGFMGGVGTHPDFRRRGLSRAVCSFVVNDLLERHLACALMVDGENSAAIAVYQGLGFAYRRVTILLPSELVAALPPRKPS